MEQKQHLLLDDTKYETEIPRGYMRKYSGLSSGPGEIRAIIPGAVREVKVRKGQNVNAGDVVIILEAMKMYNDIETDRKGKVSEVLVKKGDRVAKGQLLIRIA